MNRQDNSDNKLKSPFYKLVTGNLSIQVMITLLAIICYAALTRFLSERISALITTVVFLPAYVWMIYTFAWGAGERERNMVLYGHMTEDKSRGIRSGLIAAVPVFLFSLITAVLALSGRGGNVIGVYRMCTAPFIWLVNPLIEYTPYALVLTAVFSPLFSWLGYRNGYVLYRMWDHLIYKDGVKTKRGGKNR